MNHKLEKVRDNFIESMGQMGAEIGISRVAAQLYALLYLSNQPLSLDDMVRTFRVSKGNVSINIRALEGWGAVKKVWVKGERRDFYTAELDVFRVISAKLRSGLQRRTNDALQMISNSDGMIQSLTQELTSDEKKAAKLYRQRLGAIKKTHSRINRLLRAVSRLVS